MSVEHIPHRAVDSVLRHGHGLLMPGGVLVIECPDFDQDIIDHLSGNESRLWSIFGHQRFKGDVHYFGYNRRRLAAALEFCGFTQIQEQEPQDYHAGNEPCLRFKCQKPRH